MQHVSLVLPEEQKQFDFSKCFNFENDEKAENVQPDEIQIDFSVASLQGLIASVQRGMTETALKIIHDIEQQKLQHLFHERLDTDLNDFTILHWACQKGDL